jgi:hypothetical protein
MKTCCEILYRFGSSRSALTDRLLDTAAVSMRHTLLAAGVVCLALACAAQAQAQAQAKDGGSRAWSPAWSICAADHDRSRELQHSGVL